MALGTSLKDDIKDSILNSVDRSEFATNLAAAVNSYLSGAVYAGGSGVYTNTLSNTLFLLPTYGTVQSAATIIANGVNSYWGSSVAAANGVVTQGGVSVTSCTILAPAVAPTLQPDLVSIFSYNTVTEGNTVHTRDAKAIEIANAIEAAVATITTSHTEVDSLGVPLGPFIGGIE
jgi:hypothetical protein